MVGELSGTVNMKDVPRYVWDEVYTKWETALEVGWSESLWTGCSLCRWMSDRLGISTMREFDCVDCPLYDDEWCGSLPEQSMIHMDYEGVISMSGTRYKEWTLRIREFLELVKPYCSKDDEDTDDD